MIPLTIGIIIVGIVLGVPAVAYLTAKMITLGRLKGEATYREECIRQIIKHQKEETFDGESA